MGITRPLVYVENVVNAGISSSELLTQSLQLQKFKYFLRSEVKALFAHGILVVE